MAKDVARWDWDSEDAHDGNRREPDEAFARFLEVIEPHLGVFHECVEQGATVRLKAIVDIGGDIVRTRDDAERRGFHEDARTTAPFKLLFDCEGAYFDLRPRTLALLAKLEATFEVEVWVSESD